ncbi:AAA family ATPase [Streptomyces sp. NBC_00829]|uniref:AAA family ATPase n=1 Tax=Streptomyces sp. NBC_00829 TaxID=2903679 RepID=UPI0038697882|nr:AAA family ATPase [Streptomyces sp. NBC_00829]
MLTGREKELSVLTELTSSSTSGSHLLIRGERGLGKSELLRAFTSQATARGWHVLTAAADSFGNADSGSARPAASAVSENGVVGVTDRHPAAGAAPSATGAGFEELVRTAESVLSGQASPVALALDDIHRADDAALRGLGRLLRRLQRRPLVVVATLTPCLGRLAVGDLLPCFEHQLTLAPLTLDDVRAVAQEVSGGDPAPAFVRACRAATGGIPSVVQELLRALRASGTSPDETAAAQILRHVPRSVGRGVMAEATSCGADVARTAVAMAVLAANSSPALLSHVTGLRETAVEDAVHTLVGAGIVLESPNGPRFPAAAVTAAVANEVPPSVRRDLHSRAARFLLDTGASWDALTPHLLQCRGGSEWIVDALLRTAEAATEHDSDSAVACLRRALHEPLQDDVRASVLVSLGEAELNRCARTAVNSLRSGLQLDLPPDAQGRAARCLAGALFALDRYQEGAEVLQDAARALWQVHPAQALRTEVDLVYAQITFGSPGPSVMHRLRQLTASDTAGTETAPSLAALLALREIMGGGTSRQALAHARHALAQGVLPEDDGAFVSGGAVLAMAAAGRPELALSCLDSSRERLRRSGSKLAHGHVHTLRAAVHHRLGNIGECLGDARSAVEALRGAGAGTRSNHSVALWADALVDQGEPQRAAEVLELHGLSGRLSQRWADDFTAFARGRVRLALGQLRPALADFLDCGERACARGLGSPAVLPWRSEAALVHSRLGEVRQADELIDEELELAHAWGVPETIGSALRAAGVITGGTAGIDLLGRAVAALEATASRAAYARALLDLGALVWRQGDPGRAHPHLQQALAVAQHCGAAVVAERARDELRLSGFRPGPEALRGAAALSKAEGRVARMAAEGMTNKAIAAELFVELRTVEMHLSRSYRKLGITGRACLADALAQTHGSAAVPGDGSGPAS